jgi:Holliday junction resolvase RusA-like endonuclease
VSAPLVLVVPIVPTAQMRARTCVRGFGAKAHASTYKDTAQEDREETIKSFLARHVPAVPFNGPVELGVRAYMPTRRASPSAGRPTPRPAGSAP